MAETPPRASRPPSSNQAEDPSPSGAGPSLGRLAGRMVALPETRELDRLAGLLEGEGARVWRCPLVAILDAPDAAPIDAWLDVLLSGGLDDVIFLTGEGLRRLMARAEHRQLGPAVVAALSRARKITRGPKPARALKELGLPTDLPAADPTTRGVIASLAKLPLAGRRVGVQLYGTEPNRELCDFLAGAGATVHTVAPYVYAPASDQEQVARLIAELGEGRIDVLAFTSASQIDRLFAVARERGLDATLAAALTRTRVAAIGPVAADVLRQRGVEPAIQPDKAYVMKNLVSAIVAALEPTADGR